MCGVCLSNMGSTVFQTGDTLHSSCWVKCVCTTLGLISSHTHDINKPFVSVSEAYKATDLQGLGYRWRAECGGRELGALRLCFRCRFLVVPVTCTQSSHRPHTYGCLKPLSHLDAQAETDKQMEGMIKHMGKEFYNDEAAKKQLNFCVAPRRNKDSIVRWQNVSA